MMFCEEDDQFTKKIESDRFFGFRHDPYDLRDEFVSVITEECLII